MSAFSSRNPNFKRLPPRKDGRRRWLMLSGIAALVAGAGGGLARLMRVEPPVSLFSGLGSTESSSPPAAALPAASPTDAVVAELPTPLPTPLPRPTDVPTLVPTPVPSEEPAPTPAPAATEAPVVAAAPAVRATPADEFDWFSLGESVQGRNIRAIRIGDGPVHLAIMGAIHGGWERNTMTLVQMAYGYFRDHDDEVPSRLSVYFVPATNPDGIAYGTNSDAAWNAHGVDLNRNFASYNWSRDTFGRVGGRYGPTGTKKDGGGSSPFSEPETQAVKRFIEGKAIDAVLSYHSGIVSVTAKDGGGGVGEPLAKQVAAITGYGYIAKWTEYKLTGQFMDWLDEHNVKGVEIELPDQQTLDWAKNLKSMQAVMRTLASG